MTACRWGSGLLVCTLLATATPSAQPDLAQLLATAEATLRDAGPTPARPLFEQVLQAATAAGRERERAWALVGLGQITRRLGRAAEGRAGTLEALAIFERLQDQRGIAMAAYEAGEVASGEDDIALYERAVAAARAAGDPNLAGPPLHRLGDAAFNAGQYERSIDLLTQAAAAYEEAKSPVDLGTVYNSIGRVYRAHGRLDEALRFQKAALELHRPIRDLYLVQSLNAVSAVYRALNDLPSARQYLAEAIEVAATLPADSLATARAQDFLRANMAGVLIGLGQPGPAAAALEQVIAGGRDVFPGQRYALLAQVYAELGRGTEAVAAAEKSVSLCGESIVQCIPAYAARATAMSAIGNRSAALSDLSLTLRTIEEQRARLLPSDFFKQNFSSYYRQAYERMIAMQLDAGLAQDALETSELARSRAFLDLLASRAIAPPVPAPPPLTPMPLTLRGLGADADASPASAPPANAADLVRTAARLRSSLLLYWVAHTETFVWVVRPDGQVHAHRVKVSEARLTSLVRDTAPFAAGAGPTSSPALRDISPAWRELYRLLIAPVRDELPAGRGALVTIVPHGVLSNLSFAALQDARGRYLLEDYTLHYAPAGALLQFTDAQRPERSRSGAMLMVSDPVTTRRSTLDVPLPRLPGARAEAAAITRQVPASRVLSLSGASATESAVRAEVPSRAILHFAAHTVVRDDDPFASYLALAPSAGTDMDGTLTAQDVYGLRLSADLVVLSACRSASGMVGGDGVATFARAFLYAGAVSLIASVWDVADEPSNRLLPDFYRAWLGGATKAAALRQAQLRLLADLRSARVQVKTAVGPISVPEHPVFWAGFALFGEPDSF